MTKKPDTFDCLAVKRHAQRALAKALAGKSPTEQAETIHRLAARTPLWQEFAKTHTKRPPRVVRGRGKRRSTG